MERRMNEWMIWWMDEYLPVEISLNTLEVINLDIVCKEKMNEEEKERRMNEWFDEWMNIYLWRNLWAL